MSMTIECEPLAGMDIKEAAQEARRISRILDVIVGFSFNGIHISVSTETNCNEVVTQYHKALEENLSFIVVF